MDERRLLAKLEEEDDWTDLLFLRLLVEAKWNKKYKATCTFDKSPELLELSVSARE